MRRRRLLAVVVSAAAGCTSAEYRASGPRTPPPAPPTGEPSVATLEPAEARAQAVIRPLNEVYRRVRGPLTTFEIDDVSSEDLAAAERSMTAAREAAAAFADSVDDPPPAYRSVPTLVRAHGLLVDALAAVVDLETSLSELGVATARVDDPAGHLAPLREAVATVATAGSELAAVVETDPVVPQSVFLSTERVRGFATGFDDQSTAIGSLLDATERALAAAVAWRAGVAAFERDALGDARTAFDDALGHYRDATARLDGLEVAGSFADLAERRSCVATAGIEAVETAREAVDAARAGEPERAEQLLNTAETTRNRCQN